MNRSVTLILLCLSVHAIAPLQAQEPKWEVFLKVIDEQTGEPIPMPEIEIQIGKQKRTYVGNLNGEFTHAFDTREPRYLYLRARAKGYAPMRAFWRNRAGQPADLLPKSFVFPMQKSITVGGIIVDDNGDPVEGAIVLFSAGDNKTFPARRVNPSFRDERTVTNEEGRWECDLVPPNPSSGSINVQHPDFAFNDTNYSVDRSFPALIDKTYKRRIRRGFHVSGKVIDQEGNPVVGATLAVSELNITDRLEKFPTTDKDGNYKFPRVSPNGEYDNEPRRFTVTVVSPDFAPQMKPVPGFANVPIGDDPDNRVVDFQLDAGHQLTVKLVDRDDNPVAGASVTPGYWKGVESLTALRDFFIPSRSDNNGVWIWSNAPKDRINLSVSHRDFSYLNNHQIIVGEKLNETKIVLDKSTMIEGSVTDADTGLPIKQFVVQKAFEGMAGKPGGLSWVDKIQGRDGKYRRKILFLSSRGSLTFRAMAPGYDTEVSPSIKIKGGETISLDFVLEKTKKKK